MKRELEEGREKDGGTEDETKLSSGYRYFAKVLIYLSFLLAVLPSLHIVYFRGGGLDTDPTTS